MLRKILILIIILTSLILLLMNFNLLFIIPSLVAESAVLGFIYIREENRVVGKFSVYLLDKTKTDDIKQAILFLLNNKKNCKLINAISLDTIRELCECINKDSS